ncbi:TetR/AcrR family transcriptional regulator [Neisseria sp.]|uniref:TetR/AcrR family transcriptional regulator n=1 Tax=Neisseria sp. TaxID=192066 RepID=UPI0035A04548
MNTDTRNKFLQTGIRLYPQLGYHKLSVRLLAAEAGMSAGMFHHCFESKDDFIRQLLAHQEYLFTASVPEPAEEMSPQQQLRTFLEWFAGCIRSDLPWVRRMLDDCAAGAETVAAFIRQGLQQDFEHIDTLLRRCLPDCSENDYLLRHNFLIISAVAPILLVNQFSELDILPLPPEAAAFVCSDEAVRQRLDWVFAVLFPSDAV